MSTDRDVERTVRSWLDEGVNVLPDRVLDAVLDQLPATPQRRASWLARRFPIMNNTFRVAAVGVVIIAAVVITIGLLPREGTGGPTPTATPEPTPSPVALVSADLNRSLAAGTYGVAETFALPFTITVPSAWSLANLHQSDVQFGRSAGPAYVVVDLIENVFADPCHTEGGPISPSIPSTVDGMVEALTNLVNFTAGPVSDVRVGGHDGKAFVLTNAIDTPTANCTGGAMLNLWTIRGGGVGGVGTNGGATEQIWVIDVGGTIVVIDGESYPNTAATVKGQIPGIVESIKFR